MDHQQAAIRSNRHHLQRPTRGIITEKHQPLLPVSSRRQNRLCHRICQNLSNPGPPNPVLSRRLGELDQHKPILHDKTISVQCGVGATRSGSSGEDLVQSLHIRCTLIQSAGLDPRTQK
jgi:hypothetical protein